MTTQDDLIQRLLKCYDYSYGCGVRIFKEAADALQSQAARIAELARSARAAQKQKIRQASQLWWT